MHSHSRQTFHFPKLFFSFFFFCRTGRWRRAVQGVSNAPANVSLVDRLMDNSNRRQFGMGVIGRITRRSLRQSMMESDKHLKSQLDSFEDHRPYFTYWVCTVQVLVMFIALITYGLGPIGFNLHRRSGSVIRSQSHRNSKKQELQVNHLITLDSLHRF